MAVSGASTAEIATVQVPLLAALEPSGVIVQLGYADVLDGFNESYVHARLMQVCDEVQRVTRDAAVPVIGMPPLPRRRGR